MLQNKRIRNLSWNDYGISKHRYRELREFCLQYHEKKQTIEYGLRAVNAEGYSGGGIGRPTERSAIRNTMLDADCRMIENAAAMVGNGIDKYILKSVTEELTYEMLEFDEKLGRIPVGRTEFYAYRRQFYFMLHCMQNGYNLSSRQ